MARVKFSCAVVVLLLSSSFATPHLAHTGRMSQLSKGAISRKFYLNSDLGLRYELPAGWTVSDKETVASHQFAWVDDPSSKTQQTCSKNLLFVTKHPEGMTLSGFDPMALVVAIDPACFPDITFPKSTTDHEAIQQSASRILSHLQTPGGVVRGPARVRAFDNAGRVMLEVSRSLQITTHEPTLSSRTMIRNVNRSILMVPVGEYWVVWVFVVGDDVDMDYLKATKIFFDSPSNSSPVN